MSNIGPDWASLVAQNRAKAVGVCWSEDELKALRELKIPAEYVRGGCTTLAEYERAIGKDKSPQYMKRDDLLIKAKELGIEVSEGSGTTRAELLLLIEEKEKSNNATLSSELA